ncbi:hypothetical protein AJ79_06483 [Helicocarpus griseus UAMH5409]|uniref:Uncharacterized protein n=1 Tax=Helicocarpus griseus UAMH5409 TaxID=1447875 RepID=A0A2B7X4H3_9EURO|nr:hypothetical protein AJ79_06483 [Helicocarpus griseus UAMH5409]
MPRYFIRENAKVRDIVRQCRTQTDGRSAVVPMDQYGLQNWPSAFGNVNNPKYLELEEGAKIFRPSECEIRAIAGVLLRGAKFYWPFARCSVPRP